MTARDGRGDEDAWKMKLNVRIEKKHVCVCTSSGEGREASGQGDPLSLLILVTLTTPRDLQTDYIVNAYMPACLPPALPGLYV